MRHCTTSKPRHFTAFASAAEEVARQRELLIERLKLASETLREQQQQGRTNQD